MDYSINYIDRFGFLNITDGKLRPCTEKTIYRKYGIKAISYCAKMTIVTFVVLLKYYTKLSINQP